MLVCAGPGPMAGRNRSGAGMLKGLAALLVTLALASPMGAARAEPLDQAKRVMAVAGTWAAFAADDLDRVVTYFAEDVVFMLPGQDRPGQGRAALRTRLEGFAEDLPPGFAVREVRYLTGGGEVVNVVEWAAEKLPTGSQALILFKFNDQGLITEERWYVDTLEWQAAY